MAFLDIIGTAIGFSDNKGWSLEGIDQGFQLTFKGEFVAEDQQEDVGSNLGETNTINKEKPNYQWLSGEGDNFTFRSRIFARDSFKNVKQEVELLKSFAKRDPSLKRAPRCLFSSGTEIGFTCFVQSVRLRYDELRSDGSLRGAVVDVTLKPIDSTVTENAATSLQSQIKFAAGVVAATAQIKQVAKGLINIPGASLHTIGRKYTANYGDTFEEVAKREYGNALVGDVLRRAQPELEPLQPNNKVTLVESAEIVQITVTPQSVALKNTPKNLELRKTKFSARNRRTTILS